MKYRVPTAVLAVFLLTGCDWITGAQNQVRATIAVDRTTVTHDSSVAITIYLINDGPDTVMAASPNSYGCIGAFVATDSTGQRVGPAPRLCTLQGYVEIKLAPHDSVVVHDRWAPVTVIGGDAVMVVPPGRYALTAQVSADGRTVRSRAVGVEVVEQP